MSRIKSKVGLTALILAMCLATQAYTCNTASVEKWIGIVLQAVETVGPLISPLAGSIAALAGQTLTAGQASAINAKLNTAATDLSAVDAALQGITGAPDQTTLGKISGLESAVTANLNDALLQANGISDEATRTTIVNSVQTLIATALQIQALIPVPAPAAPGQPQAMRKIPSRSEQAKAKAALNPKQIRATFQAALRPTGNPTVDAAFAKAAPRNKPLPTNVR